MMCGIVSLTISSSLWLTGMAANPIGVEIAAGYGILITFGSWLLTALVPCIAAFVLLPYLLYLIFPPAIQFTPEAPKKAREELQ